MSGIYSFKKNKDVLTSADVSNYGQRPCRPRPGRIRPPRATKTFARDTRNRGEPRGGGAAPLWSPELPRRQGAAAEHGGQIRFPKYG